MFHTTLSKGKHITQRKKERYIRAHVKGTGKFCNKVQVKRTGKHIIESQEKGQEILKPRSKERVLTIYMYTNQPRSIDRAYNLKNQSHKTGNNISI